MRRSLLIKIISVSLPFLILALSAFFYFSESLGLKPNTENNLPEIPVTFSDDIVNANRLGNQNEVAADYITEPEPAEMELIVPDFLPVGETLTGEAILMNIDPGLEGVFMWFLYDSAETVEDIIIGEALPVISYDFEYSRDMQGTVLVRAVLQYTAEDGEEHELTGEKTVVIENYSRQHWMEPEVERVSELVTSSYKGDRTLKWAEENDYDDFDKEVFVNLVKEYESETEYLIWVNRTYQRANIFTGSAGNWEIIESFIIATGGPSSATRRGVSKIPSRTKEGWHFGHFKVEPVVRFYPGTGYALHSRPLHPRTGKVTDERIGFPVSAGCVRMYCDDIWYVYNNIPDSTTVVIH